MIPPLPEEEVQEAIPTVPEEEVQEAIPTVSEEEVQEVIPTLPEEEVQEVIPTLPQQQTFPTEAVVPTTPVSQLPQNGVSKQENVTMPIENSDIVISVMGSTVTNSDIVLVAKNRDGILYDNAVWSILNDGGTLSSIAQNILRAENKGIVVVKVAVGNGIPKIATKAITIR